MLAVLNVGEDEKHVVEVEISWWSGLEIIRVDGKEVHRRRSFRLWARIPLLVGDKEEHRVELTFNTLMMSSRAFVDGMLLRRCLFPQVIIYNLFLLGFLLASAAILGVLLFRPKLEMQRGFEALERSDYDQAIARYDEAIRLGENRATVYNNRGWAYIGKTRYDEALADFTKAIELDPQSAESHLGRGQVYFTRKDYEKAGPEFEAALRLEPNLREARTGLNEVERLRRPR